MNIFQKVTLASLRKNRTRTIVTIIGIVLSTALICAVITSVSSLQEYMKQCNIEEYGNWHCEVEGENAEQYKRICTNPEVEQTFYARRVGYAEIGSQNEFKPYLYLTSVSSNFCDNMPVYLTSGAMPANHKEILLPDHLRENGGVSYAVGDTLTITVGKRVLDGNTLWQHRPNYLYDDSGDAVVTEEKLVDTREMTYTVAGFYERPEFEPYDAPGYTAITITASGLPQDAVYDIYFRMNDPKEVYDFAEAMHLNANFNRDLLMFSGASKYDSFYTTLYGLTAIIIGLIVFGSVSLIYNAFAISVSERTKQFGLLSSIGATKKQLRRMVFFEGFAVSLIGIPIGILLGIAGIGVTLHLLGERFIMMAGSRSPMHLSVSPASILIACAVALLTVMISAWIPSRRATKVTAVEAIRQTREIQTEKKEIRTPKFVTKFFGLSGTLAHKHYKRSKKKYRTTIVSLFMSIVLFISVSAFTDYLLEAGRGAFMSMGFDIAYEPSEKEIANVGVDNMLTMLADVDHVEKAAYVKRRAFNVEIPISDVTPEAYEMRKELYTQEDNLEEGWMNSIIAAEFVDDATFLELLAKNGLSEAKYYDPEHPLALAVNPVATFDTQTGKFVKMNILADGEATVKVRTHKAVENCKFSNTDVNAQGVEICFFIDKSSGKLVEIPSADCCKDYTLTSGHLLKEFPYFSEDGVSVTFIYPESFKTLVLPADYKTMGVDDGTFVLVADDHTACEAALKQVLLDNALGTYISNYAAVVEAERNVVSIIRVFAYSFIILISMIAAANVFNTISTNIALRRREFAMLRSIGMTGKDINRMMNYECLLYGSKSLLAGLPVSFVITYLIHRAVNSGFAIDFHLPWGAVGVAVFSVFGVVFITMLYAMGKLKKDNLIDALKNENI
ncbi:MAG: ABC transporter permease [Ruminococcus sp.]|nr:ABC transporter permease [Ruminococcus sp.]